MQFWFDFCNRVIRNIKYFSYVFILQSLTDVSNNFPFPYL